MARRRVDAARRGRPARLPAVGGGHAPVRALAGPGGDRHAPLPPGRVDAALRGLAQQHLRHPRAHGHPRRRPGDRGHRAPCAPCCPSCWPSSCSSPWLEGRHTHLHSTRTQIFTRFFPRCGIPDRVRRLGRVRRASCASWSTPARSASTPRSGGACARTRRSRRSRCASATASRSSPGGRAGGLMVALSARLRPPYDEGRPLPAHPARTARGEPVAGDPLGHDRRADRPRRRRRRAGPGAARGAGRRGGRGAPASSASRRTWRRCPSRRPPSATRAELEAGARVEDVWPRAVERTRESVVEWLAVEGGGDGMSEDERRARRRLRSSCAPCRCRT